LDLDWEINDIDVNKTNALINILIILYLFFSDKSTFTVSITEFANEDYIEIYYVTSWQHWGERSGCQNPPILFNHHQFDWWIYKLWTKKYFTTVLLAGDTMHPGNPYWTWIKWHYELYCYVMYMYMWNNWLWLSLTFTG
jgi:hypothetical protein